MSRYVHIPLAGLTLAEVTEALTALQIPFEAGERLLAGSLECAGEPVDLTIDAAAVGGVEELGLRVDAGNLLLVCGELDRDKLHTELLPRLRAEVATARVRQAGLPVEIEGDVVKIRRRR